MSSFDFSFAVSHGIFVHANSLQVNFSLNQILQKTKYRRMILKFIIENNNHLRLLKSFTENKMIAGAYLNLLQKKYGQSLLNFSREKQKYHQSLVKFENKISTENKILPEPLNFSTKDTISPEPFIILSTELIKIFDRKQNIDETFKNLLQKTIYRWTLLKSFTEL